MNYFIESLFLLVLFLPTFIANATPVVIKNIYPFSIYNKPINTKYLGKNKTYRGFISGIIFAIITSIFLYYFLSFFDFQFIKRYYLIVNSFNIAILLGFLQGFGALFGDSFKSFFKRKIGIKPGKPWPIIDGIDYIIGSLIFFSYIYFPENIYGILFLLFFAPIISSFSNIFSYLVGWKNVWY